MSQNIQEVSESPSAPASPKPTSLFAKTTAIFNKPWVEIILATTLIAGVMAIIQFSGPAILDNDGYYHIRWSRMLAESAPRLPDFKWLPLTVLEQDDYADHHFLFHVLLVPFTAGDLRLGAKAAAVFFSTLALALLFGVMVSERVRFRWFWLAPLIAGSEPFLYRMSMTRAPSLSLALLAASVYLIFKRRLVLLGLIAFLFVWSYSLFPLLLLLSLAHTFSVYMTSRRIDLLPLVASAIGIVAGLVINPYFPKNLALLVKHLAMKITDHFAVDVGIEWYPYESFYLLKSSAVAFVIFFAALVVVDLKRRRAEQKPMFFLIVSVVLLVMTFWSRRFVEYWPPFAAMFAAFTFSGRRLGREWVRRTRDQLIVALSGSAAAALLVAVMVFNVMQASFDVRSEESPYRFQGACNWLQENTPPDSLVFNTDWDDFPILFYYNSHNRYIVGLDPTYLYERDKELWKLYARVTLGEVRDAAPIITERFGAEYVVTDNDHGDFLDAASESGRFDTVYSDQYSSVLRIRQVKNSESGQRESDR